MINEKQLLSTALSKKAVMDTISELDPYLFQDMNSRAIFEIMQEMNSNNDPVNVSTVMLEIESINPKLKDKFSEIMLADVIFDGEINHVILKMKRNHEISFIKSKAIDLLKNNIEIDEFSETIINREVPETTETIKLSDFHNLELDDIFKAGMFLDYPLAPLQKALGGLPRGDTIVIAGAPGCGKTTLCYQVAWSHKTLFFQLEMPVNQMYAKYLSSKTDISSKKILRKEIDLNESAKLYKAHESSKDLNIIYSKEHALPKICSLIKSKVSKGEVDIVFIDNFQLISGAPGMNKNEQLENVSRRFKNLAMTLEIPIVIINHLTKDILKENTRPTLGHLRGTGGLAQDASDVIFLWNRLDELGNIENMISVAKCRLGEVGDIRGIRLNGKASRFEEIYDGYTFG